MKTIYYYSPGVCSMVPRFVLNYLGIPYSSIEVPLHVDPSKDDGSKETAYQSLLKVNPLGQVPVLVEDDFILTEGAAIMIYLLDKQPNDLLSPSSAGQKRAAELQWLMFFNASLHPAYAKAFAMTRKYEFANEQEAAAGLTLASFAGKLINKHMKVVEKRLEQSEFLAGNCMTIGDVGLTIISNWKNWVHPDTAKEITFGPKTLALFQKVIVHPVFKETTAQEKKY